MRQRNKITRKYCKKLKYACQNKTFYMSTGEKLRK